MAVKNKPLSHLQHCEIDSGTWKGGSDQQAALRQFDVHLIWHVSNGICRLDVVKNP